MKRSTLVTTILFLTLFAGVAVWKIESESAESEESEGMTDEERQTITSFWNAYHRATRLRTRGDFDEAARLYRQALQAQPEHEESLYYLGNCLFERGEYSEAARLYRMLIELNPRSHRAYSQLGVTLSIDHPGAPSDLGEAQRAFERNAELDPEESGPFLRLGDVALKEGALEEAYDHFQKAAGFASPEGAFRAGYVRFRQKKWTEAAAWFASVLEMAEQEGRIAARGARQEGDRAEGETKRTMSPLPASATKSRVFLDWAAGGQGDSLDDPPGADDRGRFSLQESSAKLENGNAESADFDADGDDDLLLVSSRGIRLYERQGLGLIENTSDALKQVGEGTFAAAGDFDQDGRPDFVAVVERNLRLFRSEGSLRFNEVELNRNISGEAPTLGVLFADLDGDGAADLLEWREDPESSLVL